MVSKTKHIDDLEPDEIRRRRKMNRRGFLRTSILGALGLWLRRRRVREEDSLLDALEKAESGGLVRFEDIRRYLEPSRYVGPNEEAPTVNLGSIPDSMTWAAGENAVGWPISSEWSHFRAECDTVALADMENRLAKSARAHLDVMVAELLQGHDSDA